jgi:hypothetical protein
MPATAASGNVTAETAFGLVNASTTRASCALPATFANQYLDGRELALRVGVVVTTGASLTWRPGIRYYQTLANTDLTTFNANDTLIINPTAQTIGTATILWTLNARLAWDVTTGVMTGSYESRCSTVNYGTWAALTANVTANMANANLISFFVTGIFGTTNGSNTARLKYCELDII